jgi:hypothetical protein
LSGAMRFLITSCRSAFCSDIHHMYNSSSKGNIQSSAYWADLLVHSA